jgi:hydrogenase/urease accessory protein HupE
MARSRSTVRALWWVLVAASWLMTGSPADAHPAPFSYLDLRLSDHAVDGSVVMHIIDAAHELGITPVERLLDRDVATASRDRLGAVLAARLRLRAPTPLAVEWGAIEPIQEQQALRLTFHIAVARPGSLDIEAWLFPYDPVHQTFVNVYEDDTLRQQFVLSKNDTQRTYYSGTTQGALAVIRTFVPAGVHHILIGPDHILFLVGLLLLGGSWRALVSIVTAFTIGHSVTLSLAALDLVTPRASIIEPTIALSIVFVGVDNLVRGSGRDLRAAFALTFGLVHGFGFANVLREFGLPREALGWSLFSFNAGVEVGQLFIVAIVTGALTGVRRWSPAAAARVAWAGSVVVILAGAYWFVQRVFFPAGA